MKQILSGGKAPSNEFNRLRLHGSLLTISMCGIE